MALNLDLIIEPESLAAVLKNEELLIIDVSQASTYQQVHVPGAVHVNPSELVAGVPPAPGKLPQLPALELLFSRIGYAQDKHIVVYDDEGGGWAGRFIWTLDLIGHTQYSYLNGGIHAWYKDGFPIESEPVQASPTEVHLDIDPGPRAELSDVLCSLEDDTCKIWDARSYEEYVGTKLSSARGGHIPGAVNLDWLDTMDKTRNLRLFPLEDLKMKLESVGISEGNSIITHCQTHHRSGLTYLIGKALGFNIRAYDGSWSEWGNLEDTPIETGES